MFGLESKNPEGVLDITTDKGRRTEGKRQLPFPFF